jgi:hypothetical protein
MTFYLTRGKVSQDTMDALVQTPQDRLITMTRVLHDIGAMKVAGEATGAYAPAWKGDS